MRVRGANAANGGHVIGYPAMTAFLGFAFSVCRDVSSISGRPVKAKSVFVMHHDGSVRTHGRYGDKFTHKKSVHTYSEFPDAARAAMIHTPPIELQPQCDIDVTIGIELDRELQGSVFDAKTQLVTRAFGGVVTEHGEPILIEDPLDRLSRLRTGWFVIDRTELLADGADALDALISILGNPERRRERFAAGQIGYRAVSTIKRRQGTRDEQDHAFVESVTGLTQFVPRHEILKTSESFKQALWTPTIDREAGFFLMKGQRK